MFELTFVGLVCQRLILLKRVVYPQQSTPPLLERCCARDLDLNEVAFVTSKAEDLKRN